MNQTLRDSFEPSKVSLNITCRRTEWSPRLSSGISYRTVYSGGLLSPCRSGPSNKHYIILTRVHIYFEKHVRILFGTYVQTHERHDNSMAARTSPTIALGSTGNQRGRHYFLALRTGRVVHRTRWNKLAIPQDVINRVSAEGHLQDMPQTQIFAGASVGRCLMPNTTLLTTMTMTMNMSSR
jgi:hypothetical protein